MTSSSVLSIHSYGSDLLVTARSAVAAIIRAKLTALNSAAWVYSNECSDPFTVPGLIWSIPAGGLTSDVDMISVDIYKTGEGEPTAVEAFYSEHMKPKMQPSQGLVVVPGLFGSSNLTAGGSVAAQQTALLAKLDGYQAWMKREPRIVGVNVWHWMRIPHTAESGSLYSEAVLDDCSATTADCKHANLWKLVPSVLIKNGTIFESAMSTTGPKGICYALNVPGAAVDGHQVVAYGDDTRACATSAPQNSFTLGSGVLAMKKGFITATCKSTVSCPTVSS